MSDIKIMRKQIEDSMSVVSNLEVRKSKVSERVFHFNCTVPGRIVDVNHVSGYMTVNKSGNFENNGLDFDWVVTIERGGKFIERHMKDSPLRMRIHASLIKDLITEIDFNDNIPEVEVVEDDMQIHKNAVPSVALPEVDHSESNKRIQELVQAGGPLEMPEFLRR